MLFYALGIQLNMTKEARAAMNATSPPPTPSYLKTSSSTPAVPYFLPGNKDLQAILPNCSTIFQSSLRKLNLYQGREPYFHSGFIHNHLLMGITEFV